MTLWSSAAVEQLRKHITAPKATAAWAAQRLTEDTEKTVGQARIEMAAALQSLVHRTGLTAIEGCPERSVFSCRQAIPSEAPG